jgi:hypothetical protein
MRRLRGLARFAPSVILAVAAFVAVGCGGGNDSTTTVGPTTVFTPDTTAPGADTVALLAGTSSGAAFTVRVTVTDTNDFFGAAFRVSYDTTALQFSGMSDSGSFLRTGVTDADVFFFADATSVPGEVVITATRLDPTVAPPVDVVGTSDLVTLTFAARKVILPATPEGRLEFTDPKQVCDGSAPGCGAIDVTWSGGGVSAQ